MNPYDSAMKRGILSGPGCHLLVGGMLALAIGGCASAPEASPTGGGVSAANPERETIAGKFGLDQRAREIEANLGVD
jgi:hypothetical protein